jgi:NAD(P)-dependent dehydrogenase (short-subunit alcohol dehydrogenase family)
MFADLTDETFFGVFDVHVMGSFDCTGSGLADHHQRVPLNVINVTTLRQLLVWWSVGSVASLLCRRPDRDP